MKDEKIKNIIFEIKQGSKKAKTIKEFIDFSFNFKINDFGFAPLQNKEELRAFLEICLMKKPKTAIEIGTAAGGTLYLLSKVLDDDAKIVSIDLPGGEFGGELYQDWKKPIYKSFAKNNQQIFLIREDSQKKETLDQVRKLVGDKIDLLLIDGDHTYTGVKNDFELYSQIVAEDGLIVFHDINQKLGNVEVWKLWDELKSKYETFEINTLGKEKGFGIGIIYHKPSKENFVNFLKILIQEKDKRIKILKNNPMGVILDLYNDRNDLQLAFPEVKEGIFDNLIKWVVNNHTKQSKENEAMRILSNFYYWYEQYNDNLNAKTEKGVLQEKLKILGSTVSEKNDNLKKLESMVSEKNDDLKKLESTVSEKNDDLLSTNKELSERVLELTIIKDSKMFKLIRKITYQIDKLFSSNKKSIELKKIISSSTQLIKNEGIKNYAVAVGKKMAKKEFKILPPFEISEDQDSDIIEQMKKNKKKRLEIKPHNKEEIENDQIYSNDDLVDLK